MPFGGATPRVFQITLRLPPTLYLLRNLVRRGSWLLVHLIPASGV
jgi:hypothetical protein